MIFERSPVDFLAYLLALGDLNRDTADPRLTERSIDAARSAVPLLDVILFLPAIGDSVPDSEDPELRSAVEVRLEAILIDDDLEMFAVNCPRVLEASGPTAKRLQTLEAALR